MRTLLSTLFTLCLAGASASGIDKAFKALAIYDYFKAKEIFYKELKKDPALAGFGLATIYYRNDNPFHQLDSAYKYIRLSQDHFSLLTAEKKEALRKKFPVNDSSLVHLHDSICGRAFAKLLKAPGEEAAEKYLSIYHYSKFGKRVLCMRDSFLFHRPERKLTAEAFRFYLHTYPQSCYLNDARNLLDFAIYMESTARKTDTAYLSYIAKYPRSKYTPYAKEELLNFYIRNRSAKGIHDFIRTYGATYPTTFAWNMLLGIEAPHHSRQELENFLARYPDYPKRKELEEEFTYWQTPFLIIKQNDKFGFCDTTGKEMIAPAYSDAEDFTEGYAAVQKNDLYGYINKAGTVKIEFQYTEASPFTNHVAIVQKDRKYFLIDYSNKILSPKYDEVADFSEGLAIVKKNNQYGAINLNGQEIFKPSYDMISDFSEGFAVFLKNGKYGFLDKQGFVAIAPIYDWVSPFRNGQARAQFNKMYGVINRKGDFVIQPTYDLIDESHKGIYLLVKNNLYGFADSSGCLLSEITYNYQPSLKTALLTDGKSLRAIATKKQELFNLNGIKYFPDHVFEQVSLPVNGFVAAKERNKYSIYHIARPAFAKKGLLDAYSDGSYWYYKNKNGMNVLDLSLEKILFTVEADKITAFANNYFLVELEEEFGLFGPGGSEIIPVEYESIRSTALANLIYVERNEKGAYFNLSARTFVWKEEGF